MTQTDVLDTPASATSTKKSATSTKKSATSTKKSATSAKRAASSTKKAVSSTNASTTSTKKSATSTKKAASSKTAAPPEAPVLTQSKKAAILRAASSSTSRERSIRCEACGESMIDTIVPHIESLHRLSAEDYLLRYPGAQLISTELYQAFKPERTPKRRPPNVSPEEVRVLLQSVDFPVHSDVPESACLPLPEAYQFPTRGKLASDVRHALISIKNKRSVFIHGLPGSGKDALPHAVSALTRTPGIIRSIKPGVDIQSWFYSRAFDRDGTTWETGPLFDALTKGYEVRDEAGELVRRVPYLIVISDFDRADRAQAEHLRLIMDSIQGRVEGPRGETHPVLPGTVIIATGNSAGGGDQRGRCISSNIIDASILDRFERVYEFHWMSWFDEQRIIGEKFSHLAENALDLLVIMGQCVESLRSAIQREALYAEFSHRAVCSILGHAQDILNEGDRQYAPEELFRVAIRAWLDRVGDPITREEAIKLMDPYVPGGLLDHDMGPKSQRVGW